MLVEEKSAEGGKREEQQRENRGERTDSESRRLPVLSFTFALETGHLNMYEQANTNARPYSVFFRVFCFFLFLFFSLSSLFFPPSSPLQRCLFLLATLSLQGDRGSPQQGPRQFLRHDRLLSVPEPPPIRWLLLLTFLIRGRNNGRRRDVVPVIVRGARI